MTRNRITGGGVRQTASGRWQARFIAPDGNRRSAGTFLTKDQALAAVRGRAADVDKGTWKEPLRAPLFGEYASKVIELNPVKESTKRNHRSHLRNLLKELCVYGLTLGLMTGAPSTAGQRSGGTSRRRRRHAGTCAARSGSATGRPRQRPRRDPARGSNIAFDRLSRERGSPRRPSPAGRPGGPRRRPRRASD